MNNLTFVASNNEALNIVKRTKIIDSYYELLKIIIDLFKNEKNYDRQKEILNNFFRIINLLDEY